MKRRKKVDAAGQESNAPGAVCFFCGAESKKSSELAWLYHLVGQAGDKGCGWKFCPEARAKLSAEDYTKLRETFEAKVLAKSEPTRVGTRSREVHAILAV